MKHILPRVIAFVAMAVLFAGASLPAAPHFAGDRAASSEAAIDTYGAIWNASTLGQGNQNQAQITPEEYYRQVWQLVGNNFLYQGRLQNWQAWKHKYDGKLKTFAEAQRAINHMLGSLGDPYTYFRDQALTKARQATDNEKNIVAYRMLPENIGYIRIKTFGSNNTADEVKAALAALAGADGYIVDLRDNGGGYIREALAVFSMLVDSGRFTTLKGRYDGNAYVEDYVLTATKLEHTENGAKTISPREANLTGKRPLVVLVNGSSASASEMLAGALKDNARATIVGTRTFGKGIAQINLSLPRATSVRITFAEYFLPAGSSIHGKGITPDRVVGSAPLRDLQLESAIEAVKAALGK